MLDSIPNAYKEKFVKDDTMFIMAAFLNLENLVMDISKAQVGHYDFIKAYLEHMEQTRYPTPEKLSKLTKLLQNY